MGVVYAKKMNWKWWLPPFYVVGSKIWC